jgi:hypothetical protein
MVVGTLMPHLKWISKCQTSQPLLRPITPARPIANPPYTSPTPALILRS